MRGHPQRVQPGHDLGQIGPAPHLGQPRPVLRDLGVRPRHHHRLALGEGVRLGYERAFLDPQRQVALSHRDPADPHVGPHHDRSRPLVHHHPCPCLGLDKDTLQPRQHMRRRPHPRRRDVDRHRPGIRHLGNATPEFRVDRLLDPGGRGEVSRFQRQPQQGQSGEIELHLPLHPRATWDHPRRRHALRHPRGITLGHDPARDDRPLSHRVDLPVGPVERRHHQRPAQQAFRVPDRRDRHVDPSPCPRKGRELCRHEDRRHVLRSELLARDIGPQPFQEVGHDLFGERRIPQPVAGAVQPDDQAVTHQIVAPHAVELDQVLDPDRLGEGGGCRQEQRQKAADHRMNSVRLSRETRAVTR